MTRQDVRALILRAFADTPRPPSDALRNSSQSDEPFLVEEEFADKVQWQGLEASFLDSAPDGFGSALSFFTGPAFRFFLPAYLVADLDDGLERVDPSFQLWHGLDDETGPGLVNPHLLGSRTWAQEVSERFACFSRTEVEAIVGYLRLKAEQDAFQRGRIEQALTNYWLPRLEVA